VRLLCAVIVLCAVAAPCYPQNLLGEFTPDAGLYAQSVEAASRGLEGVSKNLGPVSWLGQRRGWFDLLAPVDRPGVGLSMDVTPGAALCIGGGYQPDCRALGYVGIHVPF